METVQKIDHNEMKLDYKRNRDAELNEGSYQGSTSSCRWDGRARLKPDGTRRRRGGEVKGKLANGVGSQYSHTTSERGVSNITNADAHTSAASSRLNWLPRLFKWTRPFLRKTKSGFCACAIRFETSSSTRNLTKQGFSGRTHKSYFPNTDTYSC
jgi:hypothetical protein